jgi:hypothetical protein
VAEERPFKVIVGLDLTSAAGSAVETAALLAAVLRSELSGVFVEDESLVRAAALPFTSLVHKSGTLGPIDTLRLQGILRLAAAAAERALTRAAQQAGLPSSFRTARGRLLAQLLAVAAQHDLIVFGARGTADPGPPRRGPVVAVFERAAMGTPLLDLAAAIAAAREHRLVVLVGADGDREPFRSAVAWAERGRATVRSVDVIEVTGIARALKREHASLLLVSAASAWLRESSLRELREQADCPLVLLR